MENIKDFLKECASIVKPTDDTTVSAYDELCGNSEQFPVDFPVQTTRCKSLCDSVPKETLHENIVSTYPLIHEKVFTLMCKFILHKREYGTLKEKKLYQNMGFTELIDRLLLKRSVAFYGKADKYTLITKENGHGGWTEVGTDQEEAPLLLENCLSYDEMKLSALLYVSGETIFINNGSRRNKGVVATNLDTIERSGVIIGLIGTRLPKNDVMEYQEIVISKKQNTESNGYHTTQKPNILKKFKSTSTDVNKNKLWRSVWSDFYGLPSVTFDEAMMIHKRDMSTKNVQNKRFEFNKDILFDNLIYKNHISIAFDSALLEAHKRAKDKGKMAYLHVVGIGLGVWKMFSHQEDLFVKIFLERIKNLSSQLFGVSDVHFSYIDLTSKDILGEEGTFIKDSSHPSGGIKVHLSKREPSSRLTGEHEGKLVVETYAWDGNAQPGNEFWNGSLQSSGDPAAACSTQVAELHNSHINKRFVSARNLHVVGKCGIIHISEFAKQLLA